MIIMDPVKLFIINRRRLLETIEKLGLPKIIMQKHGLCIKVSPKNYSFVGDEIIFRIAEGINSDANVQIGLADVVFKNTSKPDNLVMNRQKGYSVCNNNTRDEICELYWKKKEL
ncbi:hypothetical protein M1N64_03560 [Peptococcaceae bacterium]|nr:hypothetical protein [Peptococcaceae bacterium]